MKPTRATLLGLTVILSTTSCGYQISKATTTTTNTTIYYGRDCNSTTDRKIQVLKKAVNVAWEKSTDGNGIPTRKEYEEKESALKALRSYIRTLDIPTLSNEQTNLVDAIENYLNAYRDYWESDKQNMDVNDFIIPYSDARDDFMSAWYASCS